jgi:A/G-specific adenine glycosylase
LRYDAISKELLPWYDTHARDLPWRISPVALKDGIRPDPYRVWLSEIMLQQTTVAAVRSYFEDFTMRWPRVENLAAADDADVMAAWAGLGYYARARNLLKCARVVVSDHGARFPQTEEELLALPGIGPYTAAAIAAIAFGAPAAVMDGNIERVLARVFRVETPLPAAKPELKALAARCTPAARPGCYAQAVMDLGATICTPRSPACGICPLMSQCAARDAGLTTELPRKAPKKPKPVRFGIAYIARREDGAVLLETRPAKGLLGGMLGWPGTQWEADLPEEAPPLDADWQVPNLEVRHTFTHFHLRMDIRLADVSMQTKPRLGEFLPPATFRPANLPTVMRKAFNLAQEAWRQD